MSCSGFMGHLNRVKPTPQSCQGAIRHSLSSFWKFLSDVSQGKDDGSHICVHAIISTQLSEYPSGSAVGMGPNSHLHCAHSSRLHRDVLPQSSLSLLASVLADLILEDRFFTRIVQDALVSKRISPAHCVRLTTRQAAVYQRPTLEAHRTSAMEIM